jgi:hypothetical protein
MITREQADAIRGCAIGSIGYGPPDDRRSIDRDLVRKVIALGLCVVESGVEAPLLRLAVQENPFMLTAVDDLLDALAKELER